MPLAEGNIFKNHEDLLPVGWSTAEENSDSKTKGVGPLNLCTGKKGG